MDLITFPCPSCGHVFKLGADKAGRKARCNKCKAEMVIPSASQPAQAPAAGAAGGPAAAEDEEGGYGLIGEFGTAHEELEVEMKRRKKEQDELDKKLEEEATQRRRTRRPAQLRKAPIHPEKWEKVRLGLIFVASAVILWTLSFLLHKTFVFLGVTAPMEYAFLATTELVDPVETPKAGESRVYEKGRFTIALVAGSDYFDVGIWLVRVAFIFSLLQLIVAGVGYALFLAAPPRFGMRGVTITLLTVIGVNFLLVFVFKVLPTVGAMGYMNIPYVVPEVAMLNVNTERIEPIHLAWSASPFWESLLAILFTMLPHAEFVLMTLFLKGAARYLRDEPLEETGRSMTELALGNSFIALTYLLLYNAGTTEVLQWVLRVVYVLGVGFFFGQLIWFTIALFGARGRIAKKVREAQRA
jgi:hypothetical protein